MVIQALHSNGYLYEYSTDNENDIELWFEGRNDIQSAYKMGINHSPSDYPSVGKWVSLPYVDGVMDFAKEKILKK